jgi:hypothetical protein
MAGQRPRTHPRIAWVVTPTERGRSISSFRAPPGITARLHYPTRSPRPMTLAVRGLPEGCRRHPGGIARLRHTSHRHVSRGCFRASQCISSCTGISPMHCIGRLSRGKWSCPARKLHQAALCKMRQSKTPRLLHTRGRLLDFPSTQVAASMTASWDPRQKVRAMVRRRPNECNRWPETA